MGVYKFLGFDGMLNMGVGDFLKPVTDLASCKNVYENKIGVLERVPGTEYVNVGSSLADDINFLHHYYNRATGANWIVGGSDDGSNYTLKYSSDGSVWGTLTNGTLSGLSTFSPSAVNYLGSIYIVGQLDSGTFVSPMYIDSNGAVISSGGNLSGMPKGKYLFRYQDLIYVLNTDVISGQSSGPSVVFYCNDPVNGAITWDTTLNFLEFGQDDGDYITGANESTGRMLVFKNQSTWSWDESNKRKICDIGCEAPNSIKNVNGVVYFLNRAGIWRIAGGLPVLISQKLQPFIDKLDWSDVNSFIGVKNGLEYMLYIGDIEVEGDMYKNTFLVFDTRREKFYIRCVNDKVYSECESIVSSKKRAYFGTDAGKTVKIDNIVDLVNTNTGSEIDYFFKTNVLDFGNPNITKTSPVITTFSKNNAGMKFCIDANNKGTFDSFDGLVSKANIYGQELSGDYNRMQIKFYGKSGNTPPVFEGFTIKSNDIQNGVLI